MIIAARFFVNFSPKTFIYLSKGVKNLGKLKSFAAIAAAVGCPILTLSGSAAGNFLRSAAYFTAGAYYSETSESGDSSTSSDSSEVSENSENSQTSEIESEPPESVPEKLGKIITKNRSDYEDETDYSKYQTHSGEILRYNFGKFTSGDYITLQSGAQVRNCTDIDNSELETAAKTLPEIKLPENSESPTVLIYHTHTTESYLPENDWYDADYPNNNRDPDKSVVAVGDALCEALASRGISVVHDCTVHDYPQYTGAYYRSADTIVKNMEDYPDLQLILDIHRDGIGGSDGSPIAPTAEIDGKTAAQFMIITGCDNEIFDMPDYMENYKLACLLQNAAETAYPTLARPVLFDYRNYNQDMSPGALLIEVGSQGNSLEEAVYTGELLGNIIADALECFS